MNEELYLVANAYGQFEVVKFDQYGYTQTIYSSYHLEEALRTAANILGTPIMLPIRRKS